MELPENISQILHDKISADRANDLDSVIKNHNATTTKIVSGIENVLDCVRRGFIRIPEKSQWFKGTDEEYLLSRLATAVREVDYGWNGVQVEPEQLPELHAMVGKISKFTLSESPRKIVDEEKGLVQLDIEFVPPLPQGFPYFYMVKPLPPGAKCRIVKEITSSVSTSLVCDVPELPELPELPE